ncbi:MAG: hypothetical protein J6I76_16370 [Oribacterium sp.]|nr:hypothetical protein [Oribacterium sp.]
MQLNSDVLNKVTYLTGSAEIAAELPSVPAKVPFDETIVNFLNEVSREIMKDPRSRAYSDVVTFGFWIRKGSVLKLKERFISEGLHLGKGVAFHIAPSNVPVNFAYSLVSGLLTGNANVVRVPSKDFPQVTILTEAFNKVLECDPDMKPYILCVRYGRDSETNDLFSSIADVRITWGGNNTIAELRKSPLPPRSGEITFADRYSLAVIDADSYLSMENKDRVAEDFYNDTFFSDQNACTSPRIIVWTGESVEEAKNAFWKSVHELVEKKYTFQAIQGVNKLTKAFLIAVREPGVKVEEHQDNLIVRVKVPEITDYLMDYRDNSGYFYEYDCKDILDLVPLCNDKRCQTIAYIGDSKNILPLIQSGVKGIDRVVPIGKTMDFDLIWDGYNLPSLLTRTIVMG